MSDLTSSWVVRTYSQFNFLARDCAFCSWWVCASSSAAVLCFHLLLQQRGLCSQGTRECYPHEPYYYLFSLRDKASWKISNFIQIPGNRRIWSSPVLPRKLVVSLLLSRQCSVCLSWFREKHGPHWPLMKTDLLVFITKCPLWSPGSCWCSIHCSKMLDFRGFFVPCLLEVFCC